MGGSRVDISWKRLGRDLRVKSVNILIGYFNDAVDD